jgi:hypothetical protein
MTVLEGTQADPSKQQYNHLLFGAFKLLIYTLNTPERPYDLKALLTLLLKDFFFNKQTRRIRHDTTLKLLYESLKKILFSEQSLIELVVQEITPQLQRGGWRRNSYNSWML